MDITSLIERLEGISNEVDERFGDLGEGELNRRPSAGTWSIAEVLQHLIVYNESYYPAFEAILENRQKLPWHARIPMMPSMMGKLLLKLVKGSRKRKVKTFSTWEPDESEIPSDIVERFSSQQEELRAWFQKLTPYTDHGIIIPSPASRNFVYPLNTALELIVAHEARHLEQAKEVEEGFGDRRR